MPELEARKEVRFRGIPVSKGVCHGRALVFSGDKTDIPRYEIAEETIKDEISRLEQAMVQTRHQIHEVQRRVTEAMGTKDASIFEAHLLILEDQTLIEEITRIMESQRVNVEYAYAQVSEKYATSLEAVEDEYLRERAADMRDVRSRIIGNLLGQSGGPDLHNISEPCVIISHDLTPSTTAQLDKSKVLGFATEIGSKTSHTAIMARSLQIPAVVGLEKITAKIESGQLIVLDGINGLVILNPNPNTLYEYGQRSTERVDWSRRLQAIAKLPCETLDGKRIVLSGNLEQVSDAERVLDSGACGVGLFRTEFLFINRKTLPDEEEQFLAYKSVAETLKPDPVIIRTLDIGGDKMLSYLNVPVEMNPFLGWRAIRFCLQETDLFRIQLRAILRASHYGSVKVLYPMLSGVPEIEQANRLMAECKEELEMKQIPFDPNIEVGGMIEVPSAVMVADSFARRLQFLSIGTNDLIQYTLAADRMNEKVAHLYEPTHPAIVRMIKTTVDAAHQNKIWVGVCGEMAGEPAMIPLLLGLGVDELSATPSVVPQIKHLIRNLSMEDALHVAEFALRSESSLAILEKSETLARKAAPLVFEQG